MDTSNIFGLSGDILFKSRGPYDDSDFAGVYCDYIDAISLAGGIPIILPIIEDEASIRQQLQGVHVLVLTGGCDVNPKVYGEEPSPKLEAIVNERDTYDLRLIRIAVEMRIPILGICRGMQILNVAFGGSLYQDIAEVVSIAHRQTMKRNEPCHKVNVVSPSLLHQIVGATSLLTNSFHHQAIKKLAPGFIVTATSSDGIIEALEKPGDTPILALQWHPEMMAAKDPQMLKIFQYFAGLSITR